MANPFDQFDSQTEAPPAAANPFDQFDASPTALAKKAQPVTMGDKFAQGVGDPYVGMAQMGARMGDDTPMLSGAGLANASSNMANQDQTAANIDSIARQRESDWQARRTAAGDKGFELARMGGNILGSAPAMAVNPMMGAPESLGGALFSGALNGALSSSLMPVTNGDFASEKAKQVGLGAVTGAATSGASYGIGSALTGRKPNLGDDYSNAVSYLQNRGIKPSVGQLIGETAAKAEDVTQPFSVFAQQRAIKQLNTAAYNEAARPVAEAFDEAVPDFGAPGFEGVKKLGNYISDKFNDIKSNISLHVDNDLLGQFGQISQEAATPRKAVSDDLQSIISKEVLERLNGSDTLTGSAFKDVEEALTKRASQYARGTPDDRNLAQGIYDSLDAMRQKLAADNPEYASKLQALNKGWAILTRVEGAVKQNSNNGIFSPAQLSGAVRGMDDSVRHRAFARGEALLQPLANAGRMVLGQSYPNSGTPGRMLGLSLATGAPLAAAYSHPFGAAALGISSLAYTPIGQRAISALSQRSGEIPPLLGRSLQSASPLLGGGAGALLGP